MRLWQKMENEKEELLAGEAVMEPSQGVGVSGVELRVVGGCLNLKREVGKDLEVRCESRNKLCSVQFYRGEELVYKVDVCSSGSVYSADRNVLLFRDADGSAMAMFASKDDAAHVLSHIHRQLTPQNVHSVFNLRTEESSAKQYFQFYGYLSQQQNMMQDYVRTSTFQTAILHNIIDFKEKVVLDVGAGTGVLSFFALQGGAKKVYAVEASNMSSHCSKLVKANKFSDRMTVIAGKIEEIDLPEEVDVIISEPMGYMLFNERMLETYLHAKKWLKPGGKMYPTQGILYVAPFTDEALYLEQMGKSYFWQQRSFHGVDVSVLHLEAVEEYFRQPIVDTFDIRILMSRPIGHTTDFATAHERELHLIEIPLLFKSWSTGYMHGLAFWFDVAFIGAQTTVWLSTAPFQPLTHWYQVRLLLQQPIFVQEGQEISGMVKMAANDRQSYDITATVMVVGSTVQSRGTYDLKNPNFRYMSTPQVPPGSLHTNPTETYFDAQTVPGGDQAQHGGQRASALQQQVTVQTYPQVMRSSSVQPGGYPHNQHVTGVLQTGTDVIPVINGSIISPSIQQQTPPSEIQLAPTPVVDSAHTTPPLYAQYQHGRQFQQWGVSSQSVPHSAAHQHGIGSGINYGMGVGQHGTGTLQYEVGGQRVHSVNSIPSGSVVYQQPKWSSQQQTILQAVASHS